MASMDYAFKIIKNKETSYIGGWSTDYDDVKYEAIHEIIDNNGKVPEDTNICMYDLDYIIEDKYIGCVIDFDQKTIKLGHSFTIRTLEETGNFYNGYVEEDGKYYISFEDDEEPSERELVQDEIKIKKEYLRKTEYTFDEFKKMYEETQPLLDYYNKNCIRFFFFEGKVIELGISYFA